MTITDPIVEAAAKILFEQRPVRSGAKVWDDLADDGMYKTAFRRAARAVLEYAVPKCLAGAWDEGHEAGFWNGRESVGNTEGLLIGVEHAKANNPHRSAE